MRKRGHISAAGKAKVKAATKKALAKRKTRSAKLGSGMAEKTRKTIKGRKARTDAAIKRAGG